MQIVKALYIDSDASNAFRGRFWYLIVDESPNYLYEKRKLLDSEIPSYERRRNKDLYYAKDKFLISSYIHSPGTSDVFDGSAVVIPMKDGEELTFKGDLWSAGQNLVNENIFGVGVNTVEKLKKCYVFMGANYIDTDYFNKWIDDNPDKIESYERGKLS